jgi:tetratricopeptide (TPR) repeat protein
MPALAMLFVTLAVVFLGGWSSQFDKGYEAASSGQADAAIYHYSQALESGDLSRQNRARALNNRAIAYIQKGSFVRAMVDLDLAVQLAPDDLSIARNRQATLVMSAGTTQVAVQSASLQETSTGLRTQPRSKLFGLL